MSEQGVPIYDPILVPASERGMGYFVEHEAFPGDWRDISGNCGGFMEACARMRRMEESDDRIGVSENYRVRNWSERRPNGGWEVLE